MNLLNIILFWIFFGFLGAYVARKKGRNQRTWFILGLVFGILAVLVVWILPDKFRRTLKTPEKVVVAKVILPKNPSLDKVWFYLDKEKKQQGPYYFADFLKSWQKGDIKDESFVWSEGMNEWKKINQIPDLHKELAG